MHVDIYYLCWWKMGKVNLLVKYCLINKEFEYNIKGILINNKIKFLDKENKMILDFSSLKLERITNDLDIVFDFKNSLCFIFDKISQLKTSFKIDLIKLINEKNYFYVNYKIDQEKFQIMIRII